MSPYYFLSMLPATGEKVSKTPYILGAIALIVLVALAVISIISRRNEHNKNHPDDQTKEDVNQPDPDQSSDSDTHKED